jgi:hypothetical protein
MKASTYYYLQWRSSTARFIIVLGLLSNTLIWSLVAILNGRTDLTIWLGVASVFLTFVAAIQHRDCTRYYMLKNRSNRDETAE